MKSRTSRAIHGTLTSFVQFAVRIVLQASLAPLVLKVAGQETLGAYGILMQVIAYLALLDLGLGVSFNRALAQATGQRDEEAAFRDVLASGAVICVGSGVLLATLIGLLGLSVGQWFDLTPEVTDQAQKGLWVMTVWTMLRAPLLVYSGALMARQEMAVVNLIKTVGHVVRMVLSLGTVWLGWGLLGLMVSYVAAEAVTNLLQWRIYRRRYPMDRIVWGCSRRAVLVDVVRYGLGFLFTVVGGRVAFQADPIVVGFLFGGALTSVYYTTQMPTFLLIGLVWMLVDNATAALNQLYGQRQWERLRAVYLQLLRYSLLGGFFLALGVLGFNRAVIGLWVGSSQYAGDWMTVALAVFALVAVVSHVNGVFLAVLGEVRFLGWSLMLAGLVNVGLSLWWGHEYGMQAVMVASVVVEAFVMGLLGYRVLVRLVLSSAELLPNVVVPAAAVGAFLMPAAWIVRHWGHTMGWLAVAGWVVLFCVLGLTATLICGLRAGELRELIQHASPIRKWRSRATA